MKFTCTKSNLIKGLNMGERIPGRNINLPVLGNILLKTVSHKLNIISTDLELGISVWVPAKIEEEGNSSIPMKMASSFIQTLPDGNIECKTQKNTLLFKAGNIVSKINGEDSSQFPLFPNVEQKNPITLSSLEFANALSQVVNSVSIQEIKPELTGVSITFSSKEIICAATDTFRLAERKIIGSFSVSDNIHIILPIKTTQEIIRIFQQDNSTTPLICYIGEGQILFTYAPNEKSEIPEVHIVSRVIEGEYPDYKQIIPKTTNKSVTINKQEFINNLKSSSLFSNRLREVSILFSPENEKCTIRTQDPDKGEYTSTISCSGDGDDTQIVLNYQYLIDGILHIDDDNILIQIEDVYKPILFKSQQNTHYLYIVMPIRKDA